MTNIGFGGKQYIDIIKYRYLWLGISALIIIPCIAFMVISMVTLPTHTPVKLGIDFTGGTFLQYGFQQKLDVPEIRQVLIEAGQDNPIIQIQEPTEILGNLSDINNPTDQVDEKTPEIETQSENVEAKNPSNASDDKKADEKPDEKATADSQTKTADESSKPKDDKAVTDEKAQNPDQAAENKTNETETVNKEKTNDPAAAAEAPKTDETGAETKTDETKTAAEALAESNPVDQQSTATTQTIDPSKVKTVVSMRVKFLSDQEVKNINEVLRNKFGNFSIIQVSAIGPSLGKELLHNAMMALLLVFGGIVVYLTIRFQLDYAVCALIALFHDAIFVIGTFSLFGLVFNTEIDSMFVTAVLTVIGFSVHDTIVVFDRIRENARFLSKKKTFNEICNDSVNQTLARSINTSITALFVLLCLYFFGGVTTKDFVLAMTLGIAVGTYSSIFVASVLLAFWRDINAPKTKRRKVAS